MVLVMVERVHKLVGNRKFGPPIGEPVQLTDRECAVGEVFNKLYGPVAPGFSIVVEDLNNKLEKCSRIYDIMQEP